MALKAGIIDWTVEGVPKSKKYISGPDFLNIVILLSGDRTCLLQEKFSSNHQYDPLPIFKFKVFEYIVLDSNFGGNWNFLCNRRLLSDQNNDNKHFHMQT